MSSLKMMYLKITFIDLKLKILKVSSKKRLSKLLKTMKTRQTIKKMLI